MGKEELWIALRNKGYSSKAVAVMLGHATAESGCECYRVQGDFSADRAFSHNYTNQVDSGMIDRYSFTHMGPNGGGYGLVQWTYFSRKEGLYNTAKRLGMSIGSEKAAVEWLDAELHQAEYAPVLAALTAGGSIREISDVFMHKFERPADQSESACAYRASLAQQIYDELGGDDPAPKPEPDPEKPDEYWPPRGYKGGRDDPGLCLSMTGPDVMLLQSLLYCKGYNSGSTSGIMDNRTKTMLMAFQAEHGLTADGICGPNSWRKLLEV